MTKKVNKPAKTFKHHIPEFNMMVISKEKDYDVVRGKYINKTKRKQKEWYEL